jgi:hypothetical protein
VADSVGPVVSGTEGNSRRGWTPTELAGTDVAEVPHRTLGWAHPRRVILIRHRVAERPQAGGKKLIDVPGYVFQALVTSLPTSEPRLAVWRHYNGRADCENAPKERECSLQVAH